MSETLGAVLLRRERDDILSAEGWALYSELRRDLPTAYVDLAQIGFCRPVPDDDPGHHRLKAAALAVLWRTYQAAGVRVLVISGRVEHDHEAVYYAEALADTPLAVFAPPSAADEIADIAQDVRARL